MKLRSSPSANKLFLRCTARHGRSKISKVFYGFFLIFSLLLANSVFSGLGQPFVNDIPKASAQLDMSNALFANPGTSDFLSYAIAIMPTIQGANLNVSDIAGSKNCDLLVPVTYIDAGCMTSLPLLTPFNAQYNTTVPINQTVLYSEYNQSSTLGLSIGLSSDNVTAGDTQTVTVTVSDQNYTEPIVGAAVIANVTDSYYEPVYENSGITDEMGQASFPFEIPIDAVSGFYEVLVTASADGYDNATSSTTFEVIGTDDFLYDNSTFDDYSNDNYNYDDGSSSSSSDDNNDYTSPTVKSVDPNDEQDNVPLNTEIKVTFDEKMDQDTLDERSLLIFNLDNTNDPHVRNANPSSKSVTYTLDEDLEPGTRYEAELSFDIQDQDGNYLDCTDSNDVDSSCRWQFDTTGTSTSARIILTPTSGAVGTPVTVTGTDFDPSSSVTIEFDTNTLTTVTTDSNGDFDAVFEVPLSASSGPHTVRASDGSNSSSATFTVTSGIDKIILTPTSGPIGTPVTVTGTDFDPSSSVTIEFDTNTLTTVTTDSNGDFSADFIVPLSALSGPHIVTASDGSDSSSATFTVTPGIILAPSTGPVGTSVTISGTNFGANSTITVTFAENTVSTVPEIVTTDNNGDFSANFTVPTSSNGTHTVTASDPSSNSASKSFTVTPAGTLSAKQQLSTTNGTTLNNISSTEAPSNQSDSTNATNGTLQDEPNITIRDPSKMSLESLTDTENQTSASNSSEGGPGVLDSENETKSDTYSGESLSKVKNERSQDKSITGQPKTEVNVSDSESESEVSNETSQDKSITGHIITKQTSDNRLDISETRKQQDRENRGSSEKVEPKSDKKIDSSDVNNPPVAINDKGTTSIDVPVKVSILGNDKDTDKDKLKIMGLSPPKRGTVVTNDDGTITYIPKKSWAGTEVFSYTISDGHGGIAASTVEVVVQPDRVNNYAPKAQDDGISVNENTPLKITLKARDQDEDKLRFSIEAQPSHGKIAEFSSEDGTLVYLPDKDYDGKDSFKFKVSDGIADSKNAEVTIIIKNVKDSDKGQQQVEQQEQPNPPAHQQSRSDKNNGQTSKDDNAGGDTKSSDAPSDKDNGQTSKDDNARQQKESTPPKEETDASNQPSNEAEQQ
jgi:hypothetical protein